MAGAGICTPELVAAVSNQGAFGIFAAQYLEPTVVDRSLRRIRELTNLPFGLNFFSPSSTQPLSGDVDAQLQMLAPIHKRLGLDPPSIPKQIADYFPAYVDLAIEHRIPVVTFTMGVLPKEVIDRLHANHTFLIGTATTVQEAQQLEQAGIDALVAQGAEAGGHRGTFSPDQPGTVGTMALVPQVVDAVSMPVIASGGIMDGRGIVAALALGASAVQMGTAFLTTQESGAPEVYKTAVLSASDNSTTLTRAFSGRWARGIRNEFISESEDSCAQPISFPWQNSLTGPMRRAAAQHAEPGLLSLWAGQGTRMSRGLSASELVNKLAEEIRATQRSLAEEEFVAGR
jgi:nitronate monooxygenase